MLPGLEAKPTITSAPQELGKRLRMILTIPLVPGSARASSTPPPIIAYITAIMGRARTSDRAFPISLPRAVFANFVRTRAAITVPIQRAERNMTMKIMTTIAI